MESILLYLIDHFPDLMDINLTASVVILFVICVRQFLKKAPKIFSYALWGIVLLRLLVPVSIESPVSFVPERTEFSSMVEVNEVLPEIQFETLQDRADNEWYRENTPPGQPLAQVSRCLTAQDYLTFLWLFGIAVMVLYSVASWWKLRRKLKIVIPFRKGIFIADDIDSPFVMGIFRPRIYLPGSLEPWERTFIIAHERHHIRRGDHIFKALGFLALTIHWFNPFVWAAFVLAGRDMEMSCDEAVIRKLGEDVRADYSASLMNLATGHRMFAGTPLAFGEGDPTGRVRNLSKWKKPAFWVILICVIVCLALAVCLLTDPAREHNLQDLTMTEGPASVGVGALEFTLPQGLSIAMRESEVQPEGDLYLHEHIILKDEKIAGGIYKLKSSDPSQYGNWSWVESLNIPENVPEERFMMSIEYAEHIPDAPYYMSASFGKNGVVETIHYLFTGDEPVYDLWFDLALISAEEMNLILDSAEMSILEESAESNEWGVLMAAQDQTQSSAELVFTLDDTEEEGTFWFGENYRIFLWDNNRWAELAAADERPPEPAAVEHLTQITPGKPVYQTIDWHERYGNLPAGKYRIQMTISLQKEGEFPESKPVYAEFTLAGYQNWAVSTQAHEVTPKSLVLTYHNELDDPVWRLPGYTIQRWQDGHWIALDVGKTWRETTEQVDFNHQSDPQNGMFIQWDSMGTLPEGQYLIGQEFCTDADLTKGQRFTVYASFEITEESGGMKPLNELPAVYSGEQAMIDGCFVSADGVARENKELFRGFAASSWNGVPGMIRLVNWHYGEDSRWNAMDLSFDGKVYTLTSLENTYTYPYLKRFTGEKAWEGADHDAYEYYVLLNDESVTLEDIYSGMQDISDAKNPSHWTVFADYLYLPKHPQLPSDPAEVILEFDGEPLVSTTDFDRLEKIWILFQEAELLGYEPKTHSVGVGLHLILKSKTGEAVTIELDPDNDICRIDGEFVFYGAFEEPNYIEKLWYYLGIGRWPDLVYDQHPDAFRP